MATGARTRILMVAIAVATSTAAAAIETTIDGFTDAGAQTLFVTNTNILQNAVGSTTKTDVGLTGVLGGSRQATVAATALAAPVLDFIVAGVVLPPVPFLEYNSTADGDGSVTLRYDAASSGLNANLEAAEGIRLTILEADLAAVALPGLDVSITLTDGFATTVTVTQTVTLPVMAMAPLDLDFPFASFAGIDPASLQIIQVIIEPQVAGDVRLGPIRTYGTPATPAPAPALSAVAALLALTLLCAVAASALARRRAG